MRGDTITAKRFTISTGESPTLTPMDLTGAAIAITFESLQQKVLKTIGSGITVINAVGGVFELDAFILTKSGNYTFDVQITFPDGSVKTYIQGSIQITNDVTK